MINRKIQTGWIILILLMTSLALTACVRPYPGSEASAAQSTINPLTTQPVIEPALPVVTPDTGQATTEPDEALEPTPVSPEPTSEPVGETTYIVAAGDTLFKIALEFGLTVDEIAAANNITDVNSLEIGQELLIPAPGSEITADSGDSGEETEESDTGAEADSGIEPTPDIEPDEPTTAPGGVHVVQPGENLFRIGLRYGCSVEQLARYNGITTPNRIAVGQQIQIPDCE